MSDFKKRWEQELDLIVPELDQNVKDEPIQTATDLPEKLPLLKGIANYLSAHQRGFAFGLTAFVLVFVLCFSFIFPINTAGTRKAGAVVMVEVNPSVVFCLDNKGKVSSVTATNADADVIVAATKDNLIGLSIEDAVNSYLDSLAKTGYLPQNGAIKISGTGESKSIENAKNSAQNFFMQKGLYVAVAGSTLSNEEFCQYAHIQESGLKQIYNHFLSENSLYASRLDSERPGESIGNLYEEVVPEEYVIQSFIFELKNKRDSFTKYLGELEDVSDLNTQIREHDDNPLNFLLADYWALISSEFINLDDLSENLQTLISQMEELLTHISTTHGEIIESGAHLEGKIAFIKLFIDSIDFITSEEVFEYFEDIIDLLSEINADVQKLTSLFTLPQSVDQYLSNLNDYYLSRVQYYKDIYNAARESISSADYKSFLEQIKSTYGSIENYWLSLKN